MREDDSSWLAGREEELPSPTELMPLSQSQSSGQPTPAQLQLPSSQANSTAAFAAGSAVRTGEEPARIRRRPRLIWSQQLHRRFLDAVEHLGINHAVPKKIMEFMSVDGLTRAKVASHLQKYRLHLKKMHEDCLMQRRIY